MKKSEIWKLTTDEFFDSIRGKRKISPEQRERFFSELDKIMRQARAKNGFS